MARIGLMVAVLAGLALPLCAQSGITVKSKEGKVESHGEAKKAEPGDAAPRTETKGDPEAIRQFLKAADKARAESFAAGDLTEEEINALVEKARKSPGLVGRDLVTEVSTKKPAVWNPDAPGERTRKVAVIDCAHAHRPPVFAGLFPDEFTVTERLAIAREPDDLAGVLQRQGLGLGEALDLSDLEVPTTRGLPQHHVLAARGDLLDPQAPELGDDRLIALGLALLFCRPREPEISGARA